MAEKVSTSPPGTLPQPVRRSTKHKRPEYGLLLVKRAAERRVMRALKAIQAKTSPVNVRQRSPL